MCTDCGPDTAVCMRTRDGVEEIATAGTQQITCKSFCLYHIDGVWSLLSCDLQILAMVIMFSSSILVPSQRSVAIPIPMSQSTCSVGYRDSSSTRKLHTNVKKNSYIHVASFLGHYRPGKKL